MGRSRWALLAIVAVAAVLRVSMIDVLPRGFHPDEAAYALDALGVLDGQRPIFFPANLGREPFFIYLVALSFAVFGPGVLPHRLVSAALGLATVPALYLWARAMFGRRVALLSAFTLAILVWHIGISRLGFRAGSLLPLECMASWLLYRAWQRRDLASWALAGLFAGASLYTYLAARALPLVFGAFVLMVLLPAWRGSTSLRRQLGNAALYAAAAAATFAPLGLYFASHPDHFLGRSLIVSVLASTDTGRAEKGSLAMLGNNVVQTVGLFLWRGDRDGWFNLPGRPALDPFLGLAFLVGLALAVRQVRQARFALLLMVFFFMLVPGMLAVGAPHFLRTEGVIPATCILVAVGLDALRRWLARRGRPPLRLMGTVALVLGLAFSSWLAVRDYFIVWAFTPEVMTGENEIATACTARELATGGIVLLAEDPRLPDRIEDFFCPGSDEGVRTFDGRRELLRPGEAAGKDLYYVYPSSVARVDRRECAYLPCASPLAVLQGRLGETVATVLRVSSAAEEETGVMRPLDAFVAPYLQISGISVKDAFPPGAVLAVDLRTRILRRADDRPVLRLFLHLVDANWHSWAASEVNLKQRRTRAVGDAFVLPLNTAAADDTLVHWLDLATPASLPAGVYQLQVYVSATAGEPPARLRVQDQRGRDVGDSVVVAKVRAVAAAAPPPAPEHGVDARLGGKVRLIGYDLVPPVRAGEPLRLQLHWQAVQPVAEDYTVFVHVVDDEGELVAQHDGQPQGGKLPTSLWLAGETVLDAHQIALAPVLPGKRVSVLVGMYRLESGQRLAVDGAGALAAGDHLRLPAIAVPN